MKVRCKVIQSPRFEPVSKSEAMHHVNGEEEDKAYLDTLIPRARKRFEDVTNRLLVEQTWIFSYDCFSSEIEIPYAPLQRVLSLKYIDGSGQLVELPSSEYRVINTGLKSVITPKLGGCFPSLPFYSLDAVQIECVIGHARVNQDGIALGLGIEDADRFELAKQAILILVADWFKNREDTAPVTLYEAPNAFKSIAHELSVSVL